MADYTTIDDPSAHFQVLTYTGNSTSTTSADRSLTNTGNSNLQPDVVWIYNRDTAVNSGARWWDSSRGVGQNKGISSASNDNQLFHGRILSKDLTDDSPLTVLL